MNIWRSKHYNNEEVIIRFVESRFFNVVYWRWAKPSSWREKIFGCGWNKIYEYRNYSYFDYNDSSQWEDKVFRLDSSLPKIKNYVTQNIHIYQEMEDYFGITKSERLYSEAKRKYEEKEIEKRKLRKQLYAKS